MTTALMEVSSLVDESPEILEIRADLEDGFADHPRSQRLYELIEEIVRGGMDLKSRFPISAQGPQGVVP